MPKYGDTLYMCKQSKTFKRRVSPIEVMEVSGIFFLEIKDYVYKKRNVSQVYTISAKKNCFLSTHFFYHINKKKRTFRAHSPKLLFSSNLFHFHHLPKFQRLSIKVYV